MDPARWQQIERLYHQAQARAAVERGAFLADACTGDDALRQEVQALLDSPATAEGFLSGAAFEAAGAGRAATLTGRRLGGYHVQERIGAGGMGEVYRARDPRLGRDVAIKILPPGLIADPDRLARRAGGAGAGRAQSPEHRHDSRSRRHRRRSCAGDGADRW
jgi:hypothetical protein